MAAGLVPIICIGEHLEVREAGEHVSHCENQLRGSLAGLSAEQIAKVVIAYEPIWAIGTGRVASSSDAQEVCAAIRKEVASLASPKIDGGLVGGASLDGEQFATLAAIAAGGPLP